MTNSNAGRAKFTTAAGWWVGWGIILVAVGIFVVRNGLQQIATVRGEGPPADHAGQLELIARYAVAARQLAGGAAAGAQLLGATDTIARSDADHLRVALAAGELVSAEEAIARLEKLAFAAPAATSPRASTSSPRDTFASPRPSRSSPRDAFASPRPSAAVARDAADLLRIYSGAGELPGEIRDGLIDRYGWFAKLALSHGRAEGDPLRDEVMEAARRTLVAVLGLLLLAGVMLLAGVVVGVVGIVKLARRRLPRRYVGLVSGELPRPSAWLMPMAVFLGAFLVAMAVMRLPGMAVRARTISYLALLVSVPVALAWPLVAGVGFGAWRRGLGLVGNPLREIPAGVAGYLAALPVYVAGIVVTGLLVRITGVDAAHPIINDTARSAGSVAMLYVLACVWAPVTEELLFRGALYTHMRQRHGVLVSAGVSAVIFAAIHPQGVLAIPALATLAIGLAVIREWRGSIYGCMAAHAVNNGIVLTMLVLAVGG